MANDPRALAAFSMVTASLTGDRELRMSSIQAFNEPAEAIGSLLRVTDMLVKMIAELLGVDDQEALRRIGLAIAQGD
jgi:uncharacterized tellurite resistance protein B-like protein